MCGFTGIWYAQKNKPVDHSLLKKMTGIITHRGPDSEGYHFAGSAGLGFRRLSIIDLKAGQQPMCDAQGRAWIVFNGEIYNFRELRSDLEKKGYILITTPTLK